MSSKAGAWSYSKMKNFDTCPKQFYHVTVLKEHPFKETAATKYGNEFHKAAENFIGKAEPLPRLRQHFRLALDAARRWAAGPDPLARTILLPDAHGQCCVPMDAILYGTAAGRDWDLTTTATTIHCITSSNCSSGKTTCNWISTTSY